MNKNIEVVDEAGNVYEPTWPKRANGLVKSGRARFIAENKICLACPPHIEMEGKQMSENTNSKLTINYLLDQIEKISNETGYLHEVIKALDNMDNAGVPGDMTGSSKAEALASVVKCRETTNQQLLSVYTQMYMTLTNE